MLKLLLATVASFALLSAAAAADLPRTEPLPVATVGKAPIGKLPGARCGYEPCVPVGCPDRYSCYSLYGAYGPYGGPAYLTRYTYAGWGYR
jgi:hypothetical protein